VNVWKEVDSIAIDEYSTMGRRAGMWMKAQRIREKKRKGIIGLLGYSQRFVNDKKESGAIARTWQAKFVRSKKM
jgi:hypothetical protein